MTTDMIAWLRGQLDQADAVVARNRGQRGIGEDGCYPDYQTYDGPDIDAASDYLTKFSPPVIAASIAATRAIIELHHSDPDGCCAVCATEGELEVYWDGENETRVSPWRSELYPCRTLRLTAQQYAGRTGWREEWAA